MLRRGQVFSEDRIYRLLIDQMWSVNGVRRNKRQFQSSYTNNWKNEVAIYHDEDPGKQVLWRKSGFDILRCNVY